MKKRTRIILYIAAVILAFTMFAVTWFYVVIWEPNRRFYHNEVWCTNASTNDIRNLCHHIISHRPGCPHDPFIHLCHIGNAESVPLLIQALNWQTPEGKETGICTTDHCLDALRSLTGEDFGYLSTDWEQWWKETGSTLPVNYFHPRELKKRNTANK